MATGIGSFRHVVAVELATSGPDGEGGTVITWTPIAPGWPVAIRPATARDQETRGAGTTIAPLSHVVTGRYRSDVTIDARIRFGARVLTIVGVSNRDERGIVLDVACIELL